MPGRKTPLATNHYYHIFNHGIDDHITFRDNTDYIRVIEAMFYYQYDGMSIKLSTFHKLAPHRKIDHMSQAEQSLEKLVNIVTYSFMPNHFHLQIEQAKEGGISKFMSNFENSYTRYFNTKYHRKGPIFLHQFQSVLNETDEQMLHTHRYIHLNQYTGHVVETMDELFTYPWSSLTTYLDGNEINTLKKQIILQHFSNIDGYKAFLTDQAEYQRTLDLMKHLLIDQE